MGLAKLHNFCIDESNVPQQQRYKDKELHRHNYYVNSGA
jgi:hypothetical protein